MSSHCVSSNGRNGLNSGETIRETKSKSDEKLSLHIRKSDFLSAVHFLPRPLALHATSSRTSRPSLSFSVSFLRCRKQKLRDDSVLRLFIPAGLAWSCCAQERSTKLYRICGRGGRFLPTTLPRTFPALGLFIRLFQACQPTSNV